MKLVVGEGENLGSPPRALRAAWRDRAHSLEMLAAVAVGGVALQDVGQLQDSVHAFVTSNYLKLPVLIVGGADAANS